MKPRDYSQQVRQGQPCELVEKYCEHIMQHGTLTSWLQQFDFDTRDEIERSIIDLEYAILLDPYMQDKHRRMADPVLQIVYRKAELLVSNEGKLEKAAATMSGDIWHKWFAPRIKEQRFGAMFRIKPNAERFADVSWQIMSIYGLGYADIEKLHFFVEMVKAKETFPPSLRRMLYIWGRTKKTGKTTCAKMLVATLNGSDDWNKADPEFTTTLANEMQIGGFKVPKIASCHCCLMDECFYADMGKTYHDFKRFLTSNGGSARLPYGQEFQWTGSPNYVATSNEPLQSFIKDWSDRRFLSIEFKAAPVVKMTFDEIHTLWRDFVVNSTPRDDWQDWSEKIASYSDEEGEREMFADEYATELRKPAFLNTLVNMVDGRSATSPDNQLTLKFFVNYFGQTEGFSVNGHRREIEKAVVEVFGERWNGYKYWRLDMLRQKASEMLYNMGMPENQF